MDFALIWGMRNKMVQNGADQPSGNLLEKGQNKTAGA